LEEATRLDREFTDAWARLGEACANMHLSYDPSGKWHTRSQQAIRRALAINPQNALAIAARARVLWNPTAGFKVRLALRSCATALHINPACQPAWLWQGIILSHLGLQTDARASLLASLELNPEDAFAIPFMGLTFLGSGDYDGAEDFTQRALRL